LPFAFAHCYLLVQTIDSNLYQEGVGVKHDSDTSSPEEQNRQQRLREENAT